nr:putative ribosomal large subunit pseudouridine synthase SVR1, chloroplastic [Ipomoea batatas]
MPQLQSSNVSVVSKPAIDPHLYKTSLPLARITHCRLRSVIAASSLSNTEFNITFAPPKPKPSPPAIISTSKSDNDSEEQLYTPWIVRDGKGNPAPATRRFYNENFRNPAQRLSKILAAAGVASRRSSEELIFEGRVTVNGSVCKTPQTRVNPEKDIIYVNGNRLSKRLPPKLYFALNKPKGYICSCGEKETKSVMNLFDDFMKSWNKRHPGEPKPRLFTVGRLDVATTGLIIVTNDGEFAHKISHPSSNLSKE